MVKGKPDRAAASRKGRAIKKSQPPSVEERSRKLFGEGEEEVIPAELLEIVPEEKRGELKAYVLSIVRFYQGPLPPSSELKGYEETVPGAGNRIINQFEKQGEHRRKQEQTISKSRIGLADRKLGSDTKIQYRSVHLTFFLAILFLSGSLVCILMGHDWAGTVLGGTTLIGLVTANYKGLSRIMKKE